jgi:hypothetical protein
MYVSGYALNKHVLVKAGFYSYTQIGNSYFVTTNQLTSPAPKGMGFPRNLGNVQLISFKEV